MKDKDSKGCDGPPPYDTPIVIPINGEHSDTTSSCEPTGAIDVAAGGCPLHSDIPNDPSEECFHGQIPYFPYVGCRHGNRTDELQTKIEPSIGEWTICQADYKSYR
jgi:hypothetical protein